MLTVGLDAHAGSIIDVMPAVLDHFGVARTCVRSRARPNVSVEPESRSVLRRRGILDERVLEAFARVPRELFVPERPARTGLRRRRTPDRARADDLAAVHGGRDLQRSSTWTGDERVLDVGTGSGYQAACWPSSRPRSSRSSASRRSPSRRAGRSRRPATNGSRCGSATARSAFPSARRSTGSRSPRRRRRVPEALYDQLAPGGRLVVPVGSRRDQRLEIVTRAATGRRSGRRCPAGSCRSSARPDSPSTRPGSRCRLAATLARRCSAPPLSANRTRSGAHGARSGDGTTGSSSRSSVRSARAATSSTSPSTRSCSTASTSTICSRPPVRSWSR